MSLFHINILERCIAFPVFGFDIGIREALDRFEYVAAFRAWHFGVTSLLSI
jgi:hypothetical protein